jgi:hypothetical protein
MVVQLFSDYELTAPRAVTHINGHDITPFAAWQKLPDSNVMEA